MWPGASPAWRRRQPATRPRLGNNIRPPRPSSSSSHSLDVSDAVFNAVDTILKGKRQLDDEEDADEGDGEASGAVTYNNGLWTPPAAATVVSATASPMFTATLLAPASSSDDTDTISTTAPPASMMTSASLKLSLTPSASLTSKPSSTPASTTTTSASPTSQPHHPSSGGFKLVYLTPILVFICLFLLFSIFGRMWGRYQHASRVEAARRGRYDRRASRAAKKAQMQRIKTMWGYDRTPVLPPEMEPGENDLHYTDPTKQRREGDGESSFGSDSDHDEKQEYPGTFKILSLALLGEGSKGEVPETRPQGGRKYETGCERNGWLAVRVRRWVGRDEPDVDERYTAGPLTRGARRMRHALSRERLREDASEKVEDDLLSPTSTLSVGSGEMKYKSHFSSVDLTDPHHPPTNRYTTDQDDPFFVPTALGWRKPLPPQPQESPFRPAILNFGLRSRSKTYDPITTATNELDTPSKPVPSGGAVHSPSSFLGLGISGVWKSITHTLSPRPASQDEESFITRPYPPQDDVMSESDTPYRPQHGYEASTPTKQPHLGRTGTVLHVKPTNQPWSHWQDRTVTGTAWTQALLASPPKKPLAHSPTRLEGRKSLLLHQAVTNDERRAGAKLDDATSPFEDYSDLVDCYSTPSVVSPTQEVDVGESSIRMPAYEGEKLGARAKLNRAKTAKFGSSSELTNVSVARSKTASTTTSSTKGLARKSTVHHTSIPASEPDSYTQPLRLTKPPPSIPSRASSSPAKPCSTFPTHLPPTLRIASPDPVPLQYVPLHLPQHPYTTATSPPKRAKAVSNRSDASEESIERVARGAVQKARNREKALHEVDEIVMRGYAGAR